jgi:hypothetical protein
LFAEAEGTSFGRWPRAFITIMAKMIAIAGSGATAMLITAFGGLLSSLSLRTRQQTEVTGAQTANLEPSRENVEGQEDH